MRHNMTKILKKCIFCFMVLLLLFLSVIGAYEIFPSFYRSVWQIFGIEMPISSGYYSFIVLNTTGEQLVVDAYNINDLPFEATTDRESIRRQKMGIVRMKSELLEAGKSGFISLPSHVDFEMGRIIIIARSEIYNTGEQDMKQYCAIYILSPKDTMWKGLNGKGYPILEIGSEDLVPLHGEMGLSPERRIKNITKLKLLP